MKNILLVLIALALATACKKDNVPTTPDLTIKLTNSPTLGNYLTDGQGNTLYYLGADVAGASVCSGGCLSVWPIFYTDNAVVGPGLNAADFTTGIGTNGQKQTAYKGWPLYYYATSVNGQLAREPAGATGGEGLGGDWFVVRPDYSVLVAKAAVKNASTGLPTTKLYLIDPQGRTLYTSAKDARLPASQPSNCTGSCISAWPVFYQAGIVAPSTLKASDFGTITRPDGTNGATRPQTTYKGLPLYYFASDNNARGQATGDGLGSTDPWVVAAP